MDLTKVLLGVFKALVIIDCVIFLLAPSVTWCHEEYPCVGGYSEIWFPPHFFDLWGAISIPVIIYTAWIVIAFILSHIRPDKHPRVPLGEGIFFFIVTAYNTLSTLFDRWVTFGGGSGVWPPGTGSYLGYHSIQLQVIKLLAIVLIIMAFSDILALVHQRRRKHPSLAWRRALKR